MPVVTSKIRHAWRLSAGAAVLLLSCPPLAALTPLPRQDADYDQSAANVFLQDELTSVEVSMSPGALDSIYGDVWSDEYRRCSVRWTNSRLDTIIGDVGIRLRGNTSRTAIKKSWKLSFNAFVPGRKFHGVENVNLNGEHNDVSVIRSMLAWNLYRQMRVPSARAHYAHLKINDGALVDGVQIDVEQIDEEFVQAWFANKDSSLYKCIYKGERADLRWVYPGDGGAYRDLGFGGTYEEKNLAAPDYEDLAGFIDFIAHSDDAAFSAELGERFGLDNFLRAMAVDVAVGNWDNYWYGANNFYLYLNSTSGRFEYLPYDLDNSYGVDFSGIDWSLRSHSGWGDGGYGSSGGQLPPLIDRVLSFPLWRDQFHRYLRQIALEFLPLPATGARIDALHALIAPFAFRGSYDDGNMDWSYTSEMFEASIDEPEHYRDWGWGWDHGLKPFIASRAAFLLGDVQQPPDLPDLVINEFQALNDSTVTDDWGEYEDWVEIHNRGAGPVSLGGMYLSDSIGNPTRFRFPDAVIEPGEFLLVWCDGHPWQGPWHAEFKLSAPGEELGLFHDAAHALAPIDTVSFGSQLSGQSFGRDPDGGAQWRVFGHPTPGASNLSTAAQPWQPGGRLLSGVSVSPNPASHATGIAFTLGLPSPVRLRILTVAGRELLKLADGARDAGVHLVAWDGRDSAGRALSSGVYFYEITAGAERSAGKILLLR